MLASSNRETTQHNLIKRQRGDGKLNGYNLIQFLITRCLATLGFDKNVLLKSHIRHDRLKFFLWFRFKSPRNGGMQSKPVDISSHLELHPLA